MFSDATAVLVMTMNLSSAVTRSSQITPSQYTLKPSILTYSNPKEAKRIDFIQSGIIEQTQVA